MLGQYLAVPKSAALEDAGDPTALVRVHGMLNVLTRALSSVVVDAQTGRSAISLTDAEQLRFDALVACRLCVRARCFDAFFVKVENAFGGGGGTVSSVLEEASLAVVECAEGVVGWAD